MFLIRYLSGSGRGSIQYGYLDGDQVGSINGDIFGEFARGEIVAPLAEVALLPPVAPSKVLTLGVNFADPSKFKLCLVHSGLRDKQFEAFARVPAGCRKIIIATNIAETSITIPEVQHVIDSGKHKEYGYLHASKMTSLSTVWISKSNAKQRAGRAGRVQNGNYYALFSRARYESLKAVQSPEIHRAGRRDDRLVRARLAWHQVNSRLCDRLPVVGFKSWVGKGARYCR